MKSLRLSVLLAFFLMLVMLAPVGQKGAVGSELAKFYSNRGKWNALKSFTISNKQQKQAMYEQAMADFKKALELDPRCDEAYENRGTIYIFQGQHDRALADYNKALEINPKNGGAYNGRGLVYNLKGQHDLAIADYNKALEINPGDSIVYYNRANAYLDKKDYDKAWEDVHKVKSLRKGMERSPQYKELVKDLRKASGREK